jgi:hypothetical protein
VSLQNDRIANRRPGTTFIVRWNRLLADRFCHALSEALEGVLYD